MSVKPIVRDMFRLGRKALPATMEDRQVALDLLDTLSAHRAECVGMAANMIGVNKAIIVVNTGAANLVMLNPQLVRKAGAFRTEEGCLSLAGTRPCTRFREIEVSWQGMDLKPHRQKFTGWTAQIIQHEVDHLQGILI